MSNKGVVFLDRDGVINRYPGRRKYVTSWKKFSFIKGAFKALKLLNENNFRIFIISNQAGVSKGIFSRRSLDIITNNMLNILDKHRIKIHGVYYCIHKPEDNCLCRKPKTGLLRKALKDAGLGTEDRKFMYFVGDSFRDILTGKRFGCKTILVLSGQAGLKDLKDSEIIPDMIASNLLEAVKLILKRKT